jgi:hypothetical protein
LLFDHWIKPIGQIISIMSSLEITLAVAPAAALTKAITHCRLPCVKASPPPAFSAEASILVGLVPDMVRAGPLHGDLADSRPGAVKCH